jgi:hypothetical protein
LLSIPASEPENDRPALQENLAEFSAISLIATNSKTILSFLRSTGNAPHLKKGEQPIDKAVTSRGVGALYVPNSTYRPSTIEAGLMKLAHKLLQRSGPKRKEPSSSNLLDDGYVKYGGLISGYLPMQ